MIAPPAPIMRGDITQGARDSYENSRDGYEGGGGMDREGYDLGERVEGEDLSDSRKEEIGLEHMNQLQS